MTEDVKKRRLSESGIEIDFFVFKSRFFLFLMEEGMVFYGMDWL